MKANIYTIIEDRESGTFKTIISGPLDEDVEMVQVGDKWSCTRKKFNPEMFPPEGQIKYYYDDDEWEINKACFWFSSENQSQDAINEILHQYYADVISEACEQRDYYMYRIKKLETMWKATVDAHDKR